MKKNDKAMKNMGKSYKRILLLGIGFILCGTLAAQEQKQDSTEGKTI